MYREREFGCIWKLESRVGVTEVNDGIEIIVVALTMKSTAKTDFRCCDTSLFQLLQQQGSSAFRGRQGRALLIVED